MKAFKRAPRAAQQLPAVPKSNKREVVQAAEAIAAAINQGLPGSAFCTMLNTMNGAMVEESAKNTPEQVEQFFYECDEAKAILSATPRFADFIREFHEQALKLYPRMIQ